MGSRRNKPELDRDLHSSAAEHRRRTGKSSSGNRCRKRTEVQPYCSMWNAIYDCLFFCINQDIYDALTPEQQAVVDECGQKAVEYERYINRSSDDEIKARWADKNGVTFTEKKDMDIDSFKKAVDGVDDWFVQELKKQGYNDGQDLVDLFTK